MNSHPALYVIFAIVVGGLFAAFLLSLTNAALSEPSRGDFCDPRPPTPTVIAEECPLRPDMSDEAMSCRTQGGTPIYTYDEGGCRVELVECDLCGVDFREAQQQHNLISFALLSGLAVLAMVISLFLVAEQKTIVAYLNSGIILGALAAIIISTIGTYATFTPLVRPLILAFEIALVIFVAIKRFG